MTEQIVPFARPRGKLAVYLCGGTGINIAKPLKELLAKANPNTVAEVTIYMIDTSDSNLTGEHTNDNLYRFKNIDGGGKIRRDVNEMDMSRKALDILQQFPPQDYNIVGGSLGGASGSVVAPHLTREILKADKLCVAFGVTNNDSKIEVNNTKNTIASYEGISKKLNIPVVLAPFHNETPDKFDEVNLLVAQLITQLAAVFSRQNAQMDKADVTNWLRYDRVAEIGVEPRLMGLYMTEGDTKLPENLFHITTATLCVRGANSRPGWQPDYQTVGFLPEGATATKAIHFTVADNMVQQLHSKMAAEAEAMQKQSNARATIKRIQIADEDDDGMVGV